ncbi:MAG: SurA N-terminal domain-containing protein [Deltaproteobacteria bacterium]|nr:SurA N-terminal domain-containing protein [Deltaproteobacteria bacterium]
MKSFYKYTLTFGLFIFTVLSSVSNVPAATDKIVAVINEDIITLSELDAAVNIAVQGLKEGSSKELDTAEVRSKVLDSLIEKSLMEQGAEKAGIKVSEREIDNAINDILEDNKIDLEKLKVELIANGLTLIQYRERLHQEILQNKFIEIVLRAKLSIHPLTVKEYYERHKDEYQSSAALSIALILLSSDDETLLKKKISAVEEGFKDGVSFEELAGDYSDGPKAEEGGRLGLITITDLDPKLQKALSALKIGETSKAIRLSNSTAYVKLIDKSAPGPMPLEEAKPRIMNAIYSQTMNSLYDDWLYKASKNSYIEIRL